MIRLYCPDLNVFVDPTDRNIIMWYKQHQVDPTIGVLQTALLYEETRQVSAGKYWDEQAQKIRYGKRPKAKVSGRYSLYEIPWSGLYDRHNRLIFHGDILHESDGRGPLVCQVDVNGLKISTHAGLLWDLAPEVQVIGMRITGSAVLDPQLVSKCIQNLFVYPKPQEP